MVNDSFNIVSDFYDVTSSKRVFQSEWKSNGVPFYRAREIVKLAENGFVNNELYISEEMYEQYSRKYGVPKEGDILVTGVGTLGICYQVKENDKFYFKDGNIIWFKKKAEVCSDFIEYAFKSNLIKKQIEANANAAVVGTLTITTAKRLKIPFLPTENQKRIAQILDQADALRKKTQQIIDSYDELTQSIFLDMFGDPVNNQKKIEKIEFSKVFTSIKYGASTPPAYCSEGVPFIRATNVKGGYVNTSGLVFINELDAIKLKKCLLSENDLIIVRSGVNTGDCCRIDSNYSGSIAGFDMIVKIKEPYSRFYNFLLNTNAAKRILEPLSRRAGQPHLNSKQISKLELLYPRKNEIEKFNSHLISIEQQKELAKQSLKQSEDLFNALLQKAFKGVLVNSG